MNIKENMITHGTPLTLYECGKEESHHHDIFGFKHNAIFVKSTPKLRLSANFLDGINNVTLGGCDHDTFRFDSKTKQIKLSGTNQCVNAEGGIGVGAPLIIWPCTEE